MKQIRANIDSKAAAEANKKFPALAKFGFSHLINALVRKQLGLPDPKTPNQIKAEKALSREAKKRRQRIEQKGQCPLIDIDIPNSNLTAKGFKK